MTYAIGFWMFVLAGAALTAALLLGAARPGLYVLLLAVMGSGLYLAVLDSEDPAP